MSKTKGKTQFRLRLNPEKRPEWILIKKIVDSIGERAALKLLNGEDVELGHDFFLERDRIIRSMKSKVKDTKKKYEILLSDFEDLDKRLNDFINVFKESKPSPVKIRGKRLNEHEATALSIWSDWHCEEVVHPDTVQGLNEYGPEVARKRRDVLVENLVKLVEKERASVPINNLIIHLGGDFIGNWIHPELSETNALSPVEATIYASDLLIGAIQYVLEKGGLERVVLLCSAGNHGRITRKMQFANLTETSYETIIYDTISKAFKDDARVQIDYPKSGIGYFDVYDFRLRYYHGHQCRYMGGVGGITIPLNKLQARWDKTIRADYNLMGHYHHYSSPNNNTILNGSLKGYDAFAAEKGFEFEPPIQSFALIDSKYGMTIRCPIFCQ